MTGKSVEQVLFINDFKGLAYHNGDESKLEDGEFVSFTNCLPLSNGSFMPRPGLFSSTGVSGHGQSDGYCVPLSIVYAAGTPYYHLIINNKVFYSINGENTFTEITYLAASIAFPTQAFVIVDDAVYFKAGAGLLTWTLGTSTATLVTASFSGGVPEPEHLMYYEKRMYAWNANDNILQYSDINDFTTWNQLTFDFDGAYDNIMAVKVYRDNLYIFTPNQIWLLSVEGEPADWEAVAVVTTVGCVSPFCLLEDDGLIYFLSKKGVYVFDGLNVNNLTSKIHPLTISTYSWSDTINLSDPLSPYMAKWRDYLFFRLYPVGSDIGFGGDVGSAPVWFILNLKTGSIAPILFATPADTTFDVVNCSGRAISWDFNVTQYSAKGIAIPGYTATNTIKVPYVSFLASEVPSPIILDRSDTVSTYLEYVADDMGETFEVWFKTKKFDFGAPGFLKKVQSVQFEVTTFSSYTATLNYRHIVDGVVGSTQTATLDGNRGIVSLKPPGVCTTWQLECWFNPASTKAIIFNSLKVHYRVKSQVYS